MSGHIIHRSAFAQEGSRTLRRVVAFGWLKRAAHMLRVVEERRALATLDGRMLADIGANRLEAEREVGRRPWDLGRRG